MTALEAEVYRQGMKETTKDLAMRLGLTSRQIREIYDSAHEKAKKSPEKWQQDDVMPRKKGFHGTPWTEEERQVVLQAIAAGKKARQILHLLPNRSAENIGRKMRHMKDGVDSQIRNKAWSEEETRRLLSLSREGVPITDIAKLLGRSYQSVKQKSLKC